MKRADEHYGSEKNVSNEIDEVYAQMFARPDRATSSCRRQSLLLRGRGSRGSLCSAHVGRVGRATGEIRAFPPVPSGTYTGSANDS